MEAFNFRGKKTEDYVISGASLRPVQWRVSIKMEYLMSAEPLFQFLLSLTYLPIGSADILVPGAAAREVGGTTGR